MTNEYLSILKRHMLSAKRDFQISFIKSILLIFTSIIFALLSIICLYAAADERNMNIKVMLEHHVFGGEWLVIIMAICCIIYTAMMIWDSCVLYKHFRRDENQYRNYRTVLKNKTSDKNLFKYNSEVNV